MESVIIGILLDVSGSMQRTVDDGVEEEGGAWVRSIFSVIDNLIEHDLSPNNHVFAIGVGACFGHTVFDLLDTLQYVQSVPAHNRQLSLQETIQHILDIAERAGASTVKKWAPMDIMLRVLSRYEAICSLLLRKLESDSHFLRSFVYECLPPACRDFRGGGKGAAVGNLAYNGYASVASNFYTATEQDIEAVVVNARRELGQNIIKRVTHQSIFKVRDASDILHGYVDEEKELTTERSRELLEAVEPFIYGGTPLIEALNDSAHLFSGSNFQDHKKLLFVLSDGQPSDSELFSWLRNENVTVVSCFITTLHTVDPLRLYSILQTQWKMNAEFMFTLSSTISTQKLPRTIFVKRGWKVDITNNETKLFLQVNHPKHLKDACNLARDVVTKQDALSDVLTRVSLDMYINHSNTGIGAHEQIEDTCYANASAAVLHLAMKRIIGREGGYPDFEELRDQMIGCYGKSGADTQRVLEEVCPQYRLRCKKVDVKGAMLAITSKRPVVARFRLTPEEWQVFRGFLRSNPDAVLTTKEIDISKRQPGAQTSGHAVVLTSYNSKCLRLMNSWGTEWGDCGFFNVQKSGVLNFEFFDVSWKKEDLKSSEKDYYAKHGSKVASKLISNLRGLHTAEFECPLCHRKSNVTQFTGRLTRARCPLCREEFTCGDAGNILALNLYLTSLCKSEHDGTNA